MYIIIHVFDCIFCIPCLYVYLNLFAVEYVKIKDLVSNHYASIEQQSHFFGGLSFNTSSQPKSDVEPLPGSGFSD